MSQAATIEPVSKREQNRSEKRARALDAALTVFSNCGYAAATMDAIAAEAKLTKPTLYQYFSSKDELFREMMLVPRDQMMMAFDRSTEECHVAQLLEFSWVYAETVMHPQFLALARLVIGDARRTDDQGRSYGRSYQASGPDKVLTGLANFLSEQASLGRLDVEDSELAAEDFWGLILSAPRNRALHLPDFTINEHQLSRYINNGIKVFLKAYSTNPDTDLIRLGKLIKTKRTKTKRSEQTA